MFDAHVLQLFQLHGFGLDLDLDLVFGLDLHLNGKTRDLGLHGPEEPVALLDGGRHRIMDRGRCGTVRDDLRDGAGVDERPLRRAAGFRSLSCEMM